MVYANEHLSCAIVVFDKVPIVRSTANPIIKIRNEYTDDKIERQYRKNLSIERSLQNSLHPSAFKSEMIRLGIEKGNCVYSCREVSSCSVCKTRRCLI